MHEKLRRKKLLNPLDGKELQLTIEKMVKDEMDRDGMFRRNLMYPNCHIHFTLEVRSFPNEPENFGLEIEEVLTTADWKHDPLVEPDEHTIEGGEDITQPDKERESLQQELGPGYRVVAPSDRESNPDSDAFVPSGGRVVRVKKNDAAEGFDFDAERF